MLAITRDSCFPLIIACICVLRVMKCSEEAKMRRCKDFGISQVECQDECDIANGNCWQKTVLERCSCNGYKNHLVEMAVFDLDGNLRSAPGYGFISNCDKCSDRCRKIKMEQPGVDGDATNRRFRASEKRLEDCTNGTKEGIDITPFVAGGATIDKMEVVRYVDPKLSGRCNDRGNLTRLCIEQCPVDGGTCVTRVDIDACTCAGKHLMLNEIATYDMKTQKRIFEGTPLEQYGYSRVCGDCIQFCEFRAGEKNEYYVNDFITTCFDASKIKSGE